MRNYIALAGALLIFAGSLAAQQKQEPWKADQLMAPKALAEKITKNQAGNTFILCVGPDALIKGSVDIGPGKDAESVSKLRTYLNKTPKDKEIVVYCGCCPFDRCPNVRPVFQALNEMGFKNPRLLDLAKNIKVDWLDKGYPIQE